MTLPVQEDRLSMTEGRRPRRWIIETCVAACIALAASGTAWAEDTAAQKVADETKTTSTGTAPAVEKGSADVSKEGQGREIFVPPRDERYDWIQLKSGEWLKGKLTAMYNFSLEFDSDELGLHTFEWKDIKQIRGAGLQRVRIQPGNGKGEPYTVIGTLNLVDDKVTITVGNEVREFDRAQIIAIAEGAKLWSGKISLGANIQGGNSDLVNSTILANVKRRTARSRFVVDYIGNYSRADGERTSGNNRINSYYDIFMTADLFWRTVFAEYFRDTFKNISDQVSAGTSFGYYLVRTPKTEWEVSGGIGALYKRYVSVEPGADTNHVSPAVGFGTRYDTKLSSWLDYLFDFKITIADRETGRYIQHLLTTLESDLISDLSLDITFIWDRVGVPQPAADGTVPQKDDYQLVVGVAYEF
jgi:hypothetical protein